MADKKRTIDGYEVIHAIQLAGGEVILAEKKGDAKAPYMVCDCSWANPLGAEMYDNALGSADFVEIMKLFAARLAERVVALETERETRGIPLQTLTAADCDPAGETDLNGRVVVIKPESLAPEYRTIDYQLALCTGGFGSNPNSRGRTVYCKKLFSGQQAGYRREDIAGTLSPDRLPEWARINLDALRGPAGKEVEAVPAAEPLGKERFWQIIDAARETAGGWKGMLEPLVEALTMLEETDIVRFKQIYNEYSDLAYKEKLWAAAAVMHNGCSDDGFIDFRAWLIAQGKEVYLNALANPDSLANVEAVKAFGREVIDSEHMTPMAGYSEAADFEAMSYAAGDAYKRKLGGDADIYDTLNTPLLTDREFAGIADEITYAADMDEKWTGHGVPWLDTLTELKKRCPKLYAMFHGEDPPGRAPDVPQQPDEKESVLEKIRQDRQNKQSPNPQKHKKPKKNGLEL